MNNETFDAVVDVAFNENVMTKILQTSLISEEKVVQEMADSVFAGMLFLMTALEPKDSGMLIGRIMAEAMKFAQQGKDVMVTMDAL